MCSVYTDQCLFSACPPLKLKLYNWTQIDNIIDVICNKESERYKTKLKLPAHKGQEKELQKTAEREREKAAARIAGQEGPGPSSRTRSAKESAPKLGEKGDKQKEDSEFCSF